MTSSKKGHISRGLALGRWDPSEIPMDFLTFCCSRVQAERIGPRLFWPFLFGDHAILALFGSSVLGIGDFPFSAGMQQWDQHRNHSRDCYGDHDNDHDYDHDNDDDVHGDHCRLALNFNCVGLGILGRIDHLFGRLRWKNLKRSLQASLQVFPPERQKVCMANCETCGGVIACKP